MRPNRLIAGITALLITAPLSVATAHRHGPNAFMVHGEGASSCGVWKEDRAADHWLQLSAWVLGYVTAYNEFVWVKSEDVASGTDSDGIAAWMDGYCAAHPLNSISKGAERLVVVLAVKANGGTLQNEYGP